jgi:hypothetical protein
MQRCLSPQRWIVYPWLVHVPCRLTPQQAHKTLFVERRGRMVRMSVPQPDGRGFESRRGICEQDTLKSTARGSYNKQNCLWHP